MNRLPKIASLALSALIAVIYLQTLYYKFSGHLDSVYIFSKLGVEPYGRIGLGVAELIVSLLILLPRTRVYGAVMSLGVICGAIFAHLGPLGIEINGDGGKVFYLALVVFVASLAVLSIHYKELLRIFSRKTA